MLSTLLPTILLLAAADNNVEWNGVSHSQHQDRLPVCPTDGESFEVRFQTWQDDLTAARAQVDDGSAQWVDATRSGTRGPYDMWSAQIPSTASNQLAYWLELTDGTDTDYYSVSGMSDGAPGDGGFALDFVTLAHAPLGATPVTTGTVFRVWAPSATSCSIRGEFTSWNPTAMTADGDHWIKQVNTAVAGQEYKYFFNGNLWKPDARARALNAGDNLNSIIVDPFAYSWVVEDFATPPLQKMVIYQLHTGTFAGLNDPLGTPPFPSGFTDIAARVGHIADLGANAILLMPITEFPFDESAGYNPISQWAPEWAYGPPTDLKLLIDTAHQNGIAVLLDILWNHFSSTDNFLWWYDGAQIYFDTPAVSTPWGDQADFDEPEVRDYFLDSAELFLEEYKVDGFRMDATDFMNLPEQEAAGWSLMQGLNDMMDRRYVNKVAIAEQLPDDPWVTRPTSLGGAGFDAQYYDNFTDRLREEILDAAFGDPEMWKIRNIINGSGQYLSGQWVVNYVELHDEVWPSSGGERLVRTIDPTAPHDDEYARGRVKLAQGVVMTSPGTPALFMGSEWLEDKNFGTGITDRIDWAHMTAYPGIYQFFRDLITLRASDDALRSNAHHSVHHINESGNVIAWQRTDFVDSDLMMVANFSNTTYHGYRIGATVAGEWSEAINSEGTGYGEPGPDNPGTLIAEAVAQDGFDQSLVVEIPGHSFLVFRAGNSAVDAPDLTQSAVGGLRFERIVPNPGDGARAIEFTLPAAGHVQLDVLDLAGRRVRTLLDEERTAGHQIARWNGEGANGRPVAAGVYLLRLQAAGATVTEKVTVLK